MIQCLQAQATVMRKPLPTLLSRLSWLAFLVTIVLIPFRIRFVLVARPVPEIWTDYTDFLLFASDAAMLATLLLWGAALLLERRRPALRVTFVGLALAGLTAIAGITAAFSIDPALSIYHFVRLLLLFVFFLYILDTVKSVRQLLPAVAVQALVQSAVAIAQALAQRSVGLQFLGEYELDPAWQGVSVVFTPVSRALRAYGLSDHPNILGGALAFCLVLLFAQACFAAKSRVWLSLALLPTAVALFFTFSRSAWLGAFFGTALVFLFAYRQNGLGGLRRPALLLAVMLLAALPFVWRDRELVGIRLGAGGSFTQVPSEIGSLGERQVLLKAGNQLFQENPFTGVGLGATPQAFLKAFPHFPVNYQPVHFVILESAVETGLLGAVFYLILLAAPWGALFFRRRMQISPDLVTASAVLLAISVVGFFDYYTWLLVPGRLLQWLAWGLWAKVYLTNPSA